ncbi:hypothetical protein ACWD4J_04065 [Streptomyces sp. NPDC002577]
MRAYRNLLGHLAETAPRTLAGLPRPFLDDQAAQLLARGDIYVLEQVDKHVPVVSALPPEALARAADAALDAAGVDDFCFLYARLPAAHRTAPACIEQAYLRLARRGNAAGIEQLAAATGVVPKLDEATVLRAYDVLVAAGRLGAVDYIRQLSGVPVRFTPRAAATGARALLAQGRHRALTGLARRTGVRVELTADEIDAAVQAALVDDTLPELAEALRELSQAPRATGFAALYAQLSEEGRHPHIPALFDLCADADRGVLDGPLWDRLLSVPNAAALRFVYEECADAARLRAHADAAYALGVAAGDRALVRLACERGGARLDPAGTGPLLDAALESGDTEWLAFAGQPVPDTDAGMLHRARTAPDAPAAGRWLLALAEERYDDAVRALAEVGPHPVADALRAGGTPS